jgi:hypothetical protein
LHELWITYGHAAEILSPRSVLSRVDDDPSDLLRPQLLRLRSEPHEAIGFAFDEKMHCIIARLRRYPVDIGAWIHANVGRDTGDEDML